MTLHLKSRGYPFRPRLLFSCFIVVGVGFPNCVLFQERTEHKKPQRNLNFPPWLGTSPVKRLFTTVSKALDLWLVNGTFIRQQRLVSLQCSKRAGFGFCLPLHRSAETTPKALSSVDTHYGYER